MTVSMQNGSYFDGTASLNTGLTFGGLSASSFYNEDFLENKYNYNDTKEGYEIGLSGRDSAINQSISNITNYISNGEEDKVLDAYNELLAEMSTQKRYSQLIGENGDDTQLRAVAKDLIETEIGQDLTEYITANTRKSKSVQNQKLLWGDNCDSTTQEDLLKEMCNLDKEQGHSSIFSKIIFGVAGIFTKTYDKLFGDGTKH